MIMMSLCEGTKVAVTYRAIEITLVFPPQKQLKTDLKSTEVFVLIVQNLNNLWVLGCKTF